MIVGACTLAAGMLAACGTSPSASSTSSGGQVLLVGTFHGHAGGYKTIQSAVDAARPGDWILVAPGDYHETADESGAAVDPSDGDMGGVLITTSDLHLRGMDRSTVIVDGTKAGSHAVQLESQRSEPGRHRLRRQSRRAQWHPHLEGRRCERREPHRLQFSGRHR